VDWLFKPVFSGERSDDVFSVPPFPIRIFYAIVDVRRAEDRDQQLNFHSRSAANKSKA
jgi:hypothetical protein